ncbi:MAG: hypothetical protein HKN13_10190 [Rhodothermales bacterium]|nr:hypothetical protein [Rhodothermales bacterium]
MESDLFSPFIVFGPSKSGTTWLQRMIDSHPEARCHFQLPVFAIPKGKHVLFPGSGRKKLFVDDTALTDGKSSPFRDVFETKTEETEYSARLSFVNSFREFFAQQTSETGLANSSGDTSQSAPELAHSIYRAAAEQLLKDVDGAKVYGTKSYTDLEFLFKLFPAARVVNIVRDGRDVAVSKRFHYLRSGIRHPGDEKFRLHKALNRSSVARRALKVADGRLDILDDRFFLSRDQDDHIFTPEVIEKIAGDWQLLVDYLRSWQDARPSQILVTRYEDLKSSPDSEMARVFGFLEVDASDSTVRNAVDQNSFDNLKKSETSSFFRSGTTGDWVRHFTESDKQLFKQIAGQQLIDLGYEESNDW